MARKRDGGVPGCNVRVGVEVASLHATPVVACTIVVDLAGHVPGLPVSYLPATVDLISYPLNP